MNKKRKSYGKQKAMELAARLCAKRERSHHEIKQKLWEYGLNQEEADEVLTDLILHNFVSEERFARAYVRGKFNQLCWGKVKIKKGLSEHHIPKKLLAKALEEIDPKDYRSTLKQLVLKKKEQLGGQGLHYLKLRKRLLDYALQKGYERGLIFSVLEEIGNDK